MVECPNCRADNPDGEEFCGNCGTELTAPKQDLPAEAQANGAFLRVFQAFGQWWRNRQQMQASIIAAKAAAKAAAKQAKGAFLRPFQAFGQWWRNRQQMQAGIIAAKAAAKAAKIAAKAQAYQAKSAAKQAKAQAKAAAKQAKAQARAQSMAGPNPHTALVIAAMWLGVGIVAVCLQVKKPNGQWGLIWAIALPMSLMTAYFAWRLKVLTAKHTELITQAAANNPPLPPPAWSPVHRALRQAYLNPVSLVYYLGVTGYILGARQ
jgi:hypothetical protein